MNSDTEIPFFDIVEAINKFIGRPKFTTSPILLGSLLLCISDIIAKFNILFDPKILSLLQSNLDENTLICLHGLFGYCEESDKCEDCIGLFKAINKKKMEKQWKIDGCDIWKLGNPAILTQLVSVPQSVIVPQPISISKQTKDQYDIWKYNKPTIKTKPVIISQPIPIPEHNMLPIKSSLYRIYNPLPQNLYNSNKNYQIPYASRRYNYIFPQPSDNHCYIPRQLNSHCDRYNRNYATKFSSGKQNPDSDYNT